MIWGRKESAGCGGEGALIKERGEKEGDRENRVHGIAQGKYFPKTT